MAHNKLRDFIHTLKKENELIEISHPVSPHLEISEITDRISKQGGPALLFTQTGTKFPVLINAMGSEKRINLALGVDNLDEIGAEFHKLMGLMMAPKKTLWEKLKMLPRLKEISSWMPKKYNGKAPCQQVVMAEPDLGLLPILRCWPFDGGDFITLPGVHTVDPESGIRNLGMYRMQVFGPTLTGMHWHRHKTGARHMEAYKKLGKKMPLAVTLGGDPIYTYAATAPLPDNMDEYMLAGFLRKKSVEMVKCLTNELEVPADVDFVIEGYVDPMEDLIWEGPFGDHTGFYSLADYYPRFHVTCITHRKDAVYPATIVGIPPMEDEWMGKATERIFLAPLRATIAPEVKDMVMPVEGVFHNIVMVKIEKSFPGQARKVMNPLWGAGQMMFSKMLIVFDDNTDLNDGLGCARKVFENFDPQFDLCSTSGPLDVLDHAGSKPAFGGKLGIDATTRLPEEPGFEHSAASIPLPDPQSVDNILNHFPEIVKFYYPFEHQLPVLILAIEKSRKYHISELFETLNSTEGLKGIKVICFMESIVDVENLSDVVWRAANNIDFQRDLLLASRKESAIKTMIGLDATRKTKDLDGLFERPWPNILVMDENTIQKVDEMWEHLKLGEPIASPSLKYKGQCYPGGATAE